ncbi:MAG: VF530 family DNA-binding protein [Myxococcota bacterium]
MQEPDAPTPPQPPPEAPAPDLTHTTQQKNNPLHGVTLEMMLRALVTHFGWEGLAKQIPARCFSSDPSMGSSLKFLRKTPWARGKVEGLYLFMRREHGRRPR